MLLKTMQRIQWSVNNKGPSNVSYQVSHWLLIVKRVVFFFFNYSYYWLLSSSENQQASRSLHGGGFGSRSRVVFPPAGPLLIRSGFCVPTWKKESKLLRRGSKLLLSVVDDQIIVVIKKQLTGGVSPLLNISTISTTRLGVTSSWKRK